MRIGIDLQVLSQKQRTGVGNYALNLARALLKLETKHKFIFFVSDEHDLPQPLLMTHSASLRVTLSLVEQVRRGLKGEVVVLPPKKFPFWSAHVTCANLMKRARLDVLHGPANVLPWFYESDTNTRIHTNDTNDYSRHSREDSRHSGRSVITIHDLAIYLHPEWFPRGQWFSTKLLVPKSIKRADAIIVPSQATKKDLISLFHVPCEKIRVIPHGVEERFFKSDTNTRIHTNDTNDYSRHSREDSHHSGRYILFVGTLEPRKNLKRLLQAYQSLPEDILAEYELWIAGGGEPPPLNLPLDPDGTVGVDKGEKSACWQGRERGSIKFLGYVPDKDLPALYHNASAFVYPSLYEGFGLPVLEAMAAGVPVITSKNSAMEELFAENQKIGSQKSDVRFSDLSDFPKTSPALLVNPYSVDEIQEAILRLIRPVRPSSPSQLPFEVTSSKTERSGSTRAKPRWRDVAYSSQISKLSQEIARGFTWERTARETLRVYEELITNN
jgi:glycosyltransferase involved in cell wall biosynthesis